MITRKPVFPLVLLLILFAATTATAGTGLFAGVNFPTGDFNDGAKTGWNLGGYYTVDMAAILDVGFTAAYSDFDSELSDKSAGVWELQGIGHGLQNDGAQRSLAQLAQQELAQKRRLLVVGPIQQLAQKPLAPLVSAAAGEIREFLEEWPTENAEGGMLPG